MSTTNKSTRMFLGVTLAAILAGCGGASTTINEKGAISDEGEHHHGGEHVSSQLGRLLLIDPSESRAQIVNLSDSELIGAIQLDAPPSAVYATGGYRFAALIERNADKVSFIDGGLWQEPHDDHFDLFVSTPELLNYQLTGSRPTHFVTYEGDVAVFLDGDTASGSVAGVQVFNDHTIEEAEAPITLAFSSPQHGVAEPRGERLFSSVRREDSQSTSSNFILPDQLALYQLREGAYELEQTFDTVCPNLHGAAQNLSHVVFGCSDGVLLITENDDDSYTAKKLANPEGLMEGLRIGSIWGHINSEQFIAQASAHGGTHAQYFSVNPSEEEIALIDWQPMDDAKPVSRNFSYEAEQFVILDSQGYLTVIEPHEDSGRTLWEFGARLDITEADVNTMPEGMMFSMTFAQNGHSVYVADPIEQHVLSVDLELLEVASEIEVGFSPAMITWLGVVENHEH